MKLKHVLLIMFILVLIMMLGFVSYKYLELKKETISLVAEKLELTKKVEELNSKVSKLDLKIEEAENSNTMDDFDREYMDYLINSMEREIDGFVTGRYVYNYVEIMEEGEPTEWELELGMGFQFLNDGSVYGFLPGHESGSLIGTYEITEKEIKCQFTEYENESSATYDFKLDQEGEVVLTRLNENEIKVSAWTKKPMIEDSDLSYGEDVEKFTINFVLK